MKKANKASISIRKVVGICLILLFVMGIAVMAANTKLNNVKIILSNGYEMNVLTAKRNVSEILEENHIILLPDEKVTPSKESELSENNTIRISKQSEKVTEFADVAEQEENVTIDSLLKNYESITEKIVTEDVTIPYETITKDISDGSSSKKNNVVQQGKDGLKRVTYRIKYQEEVEIEKTEISSEIITEPINKIVEVRKQVTTSRNAPERTTATGTSAGVYKVTAYCACSKCCGKSTGRTASGTMATANRTVAASSKFSFGTKLKINGQVYTVEDRGGAIQGNRIDVYMSSHSQALAWGVKYLNVEVLN